MSSFTIEEESGTFTGSAPRHNGYYAGSFTGRSEHRQLRAWFDWGRAQSTHLNHHLRRPEQAAATTNA